MRLLAERELTWDLNTTTGKAVSDIQKVDKEVDKLKTNMMAVDKQSGNLGKIAGGFAAAGSRIQNIGAGMQSVGSGISNVSGKIATAGTKITAMAAPVALAFKKGVDGALELDTAIRQVQTLSDNDVIDEAGIRAAVRRISDESGVAQAEVAESMYSALSSGVDTSNVVGFVEQGVKLTKAGFTDMPTVIDATTTALNAYGDKAADVAHIQDVMVKTQDLGKITVDELGKNIGRVVPFAAAANVSIDQLGAGYSVLTAKGYRAADATTGLSSLISELNTTGSQTDKALRKHMGKSFKELMDDGNTLGDVLGSLQGVAQSEGLQLGDMFGNKMATAAANSLAEAGPDAFNDAFSAMEGSEGTVGKNFLQMMGPTEKLKMAQNELKNSFIDLGASMVPVFLQFSEGIKAVVEKFNSLDEGTKKMIGKVALVMTVAGPILAIIGTIGGAIGGLISGIGAIVGVVGSAISGIGGAIAGISGALATVGTFFSTVGTVVMGILGGIGSSLMAVGGAIVSFIISPMGMVVGVIAAAIGIGYLLYSNWDMIKQKASEVGGAIQSFFAPAVNTLKSAFSSLASTISGVVVGAINTAMGMFNSLRATAQSAINGIIGAWNRLKSALSAPINAVVNIGKGIGGAVKGAVGKITGHADGLYRVPYDEYPAMLHKDEMVVTAQGSSQLRAMGANENGFSTPPTGSMMGDLRPSVTNNESSTSNNSSFSPVINITMNSSGDAKADANIVADIVEEKLMQLFMTANLQRG